MKSSNWVFVPLGLAVLLLGCRHGRVETKATNLHTMAFEHAGMRLALGGGWDCQKADGDGGLYPATLVGPTGSIRVVVLPQDRSDPAAVAEGLSRSSRANPLVARHSLQRRRFITDKGVQGLCISYLQYADREGPQTGVENSHYLFKNRAGRCVVIKYVASAWNADSTGVHRMLQTGLSLQ
jgi:hypothetical protein